MTSKKILFTGGNGFIGRQIIPFIQQAGYEVVRPRSTQVRLEVDKEVATLFNDGQLVIMHDLVGLFWEFKSKFVKRYCEAGQMIQSALTEYVNEVRDVKFPSQENFYEIKDEELEKLLGQGAGWKHDK